MTTRKIIDIEHNGEKVWPKGHAKATFLSDGSTVEDVINNIQTGEGGITTETDPIFSASPAAKITDENITSWNNKVDKVDGKQLSTEDFTTALKNKLSGLNNYDDTAINQAVQSLQTQLNTLVSGNASTAIDSFNEIIAFLNGITDSKSLDSIIASIEQQIAGKMDKVTLAAVATSGSYNDLKDKPTIPSAVTESTVSGWGFTKNTGTYSKPSTGIPKSDLASAVQTSLGSAVRDCMALGRSEYRLDLRELGVSLSIPCEKLLQMLALLEVYAIDCYNKTTDHEFAIKALSVRDEIEAYDFRVGYPIVPRFEL